MTGTLIIGYGTFGNGCVRAYAEKFSQPVLLIDNQAFTPESHSAWADCLEYSEDVNLFEGKMKNILADYSNLLLVSSIGGQSFGRFHESISKCASQSEVSMITLCTVPFSFESERRSRALEILSELPQTTRNIFVVDSQKTIRNDCSLLGFLDKTQSFIGDLIKILSGLLESSPFFSLCTETQYTVAMGEGLTFSDSVSNAIANPLFDYSVAKGKVIICTGIMPGGFESELAVSMITGRFGALPEIVRHPGLGEKPTLLFIPIFYRCE